jgi:cytidine deaminase
MAVAKIDIDELTAAALGVTGRFSVSAACTAGGVGAALLADSGEVFTGICLDTQCSLGFCAEHAAIAEMLKHRRSRILAIVAVKADGSILAPCGRCRELIRQVDPANWDAQVILPGRVLVGLCDLLPHSEPVQAVAIDLAGE